MTGFIAWVDGSDDAGSATAVVGAKMGRLAELSRAGIKVPQGFTVTADAYAHQCAGSGLAALADQQLAKVADTTDPDRLAAVAATIREAFERTPVEPSLAAAVADAYAELAFRCREINQPVAVRSSALSEDGALVSFAGIFDTYLGMSGEARVLDAVRQCWGSLFSTRALAYRLEHGELHRNIPMAVGVLELVPARVSGVVFSVDPVSGKNDRVVIEATWGWGEAVVQGVVTPDHIEVGKSDRRVLYYRVADKRVVSTFDYAKGEVVETDMPTRFRNTPVLDDEEIRAVTDVVCMIEDHCGHPVDVEWVIERTRRPGEPVSVVQSRPVKVTYGTDETADELPATRWDLGAYAAKYAFGQQP